MSPLTEHFLAFDFFDPNRTRQVSITLRVDTQLGHEIELGDVTYQVIDSFEHKGERALVLKAIRQRVDDTTTQIIHKCPARREMLLNLSNSGKTTLKEKLGEQRFARAVSERVRLSINDEATCHECGCVFWKKNALRPNAIFVKQNYGKEQRI
jgi:hypothetical protein